MTPTKPAGHEDVPSGIPPMTDPLGKYWDQPSDIREAPMDDKTVLLTPAQFEALPEYSMSVPSGVYPGKCWRRQQYRHVGDHMEPTGRWQLRWYGVHADPKLCSNNAREIEVIS